MDMINHPPRLQTPPFLALERYRKIQNGKLTWLPERLFKLVLLADASIQLGDVARTALGSLGYRVVTVRNGIDLVGAAITLYPDVIVMDMRMVMDPSMSDIDGFHAASLLRRHPVTKSVPILATSNIVDPELREKCLASGCNDFMPKPFTAKELVVTVERLLSASRFRNKSEAAGLRKELMEPL
jgi:CheY-like chemotaxis protein